MKASFASFFHGVSRTYLEKAIDFALEEDGDDLTSKAVFAPSDRANGQLVAKEDTLVCGLPLLPLIYERAAQPDEVWHIDITTAEGSRVTAGTTVAVIEGTARTLLQIERIALNFIMHLSGIANRVNSYVQALEGTGVQLLDTRKTTPCLRYPEKYAVLVGGGKNHRLNLHDMLMLKDNHIDAAGGVIKAVTTLRNAYSPMPLLEVECRDLEEVHQAVTCRVDRIMLDNMTPVQIAEALNHIPDSIEVEISGGVTLANIHSLASATGRRKANFISSGALTHSAPAADYSLVINEQTTA